MPRTKIFVGSLGNGARPEELRRLFETYGNVTECDVVNRCGFVHMETEEQAQDAIQNLNNASFNGQTISVEWGRQKERTSGGGGGSSGGSFRGGQTRPSPYDRMGQGRGGRFSSPPMDRGNFRSMPPQSQVRSGGGGYGTGNNRYSGKDRRGFTLPDINPSYGQESFQCRRGGSGSDQSFLSGSGQGGYHAGGNYDGGGYGNDSYQQRDSGPTRRTNNSYNQVGREGDHCHNERRSSYQDNSRSMSNDKSGGYSQRFSGGGRDNFGGSANRGPPPPLYNRRF